MMCVQLLGLYYDLVYWYFFIVIFSLCNLVYIKYMPLFPFFCLFYVILQLSILWLERWHKKLLEKLEWTKIKTFSCKYLCVFSQILFLTKMTSKEFMVFCLPFSTHLHAKINFSLIFPVSWWYYNLSSQPSIMVLSFQISNLNLNLKVFSLFCKMLNVCVPYLLSLLHLVRLYLPEATLIL